MNHPHKINTTPGLWTGQALHFFCLALLLAAVYMAWTSTGGNFKLLFWVAVAFPVLHQVFVWLSWRLELRYRAISDSIGFHKYLVFFFLLFGGRFISLLLLAWADRGSLNLGPVSIATITALLALPGLYTMVSVIKYFGLRRAAGADHFDARYQNMPFVKKGIFRFTKNGMYLYAFLVFWAVAIGFNSEAALMVAAFSHVYIWVHYYATEKPDMDCLYPAENKTRKMSTEGKVLMAGVLMAMGLIALLVLAWLQDAQNAKTLALAFAAHTFGGRAAGVGICIMADLPEIWNIAYNFYLEILIVCFTYSLFVFSVNQQIQYRWAASFTRNMMAKARKHKNKVEKYGWAGVFVFVMIPLPVTGPVVGSIIGYLLHMNIRSNMSAVFAGTLMAITLWVFSFEFLEQHLHLIQYFIAAMIVMAVFAHFKTLKSLFKK